MKTATFSLENLFSHVSQGHFGPKTVVFVDVPMYPEGVLTDKDLSPASDPFLNFSNERNTLKNGGAQNFRQKLAWSRS